MSLNSRRAEAKILQTAVDDGSITGDAAELTKGIVDRLVPEAPAPVNIDEETGAPTIGPLPRRLQRSIERAQHEQRIASDPRAAKRAQLAKIARRNGMAIVEKPGYGEVPIERNTAGRTPFGPVFIDRKRPSRYVFEALARQEAEAIVKKAEKEAVAA